VDIIRAESCDPGIAPVLCKVLFYCVISAILLFFVGLLYMILSDSNASIDDQISLQQVADSIAAISSEGVLGLGIIVVVVTPLIRLLTTTMLYLKKSDGILALLTIFSFLAIIISFLVKTIFL